MTCQALEALEIGSYFPIAPHWQRVFKVGYCSRPVAGISGTLGVLILGNINLLKGHGISSYTQINSWSKR